MLATFKNLFLLVLAITALALVRGWGSSDKVKLKEVDVITLQQGAMTNGRRSSPVPQLKCVGGSANGMFKPQVVQCYNRGSDGTDIQWECKTDMDTSYRFGRVQVSCEGYDYPEDEYVLKGSCGLEYELELTEEGRAKKGHRTGYAGAGSSSGGYAGAGSSSGGSGFGTAVPLLVLAAIIYFVYTRCIKARPHHEPQRHPSGPPPPGFRSEFMPGHEDQYGNKYPSEAPPPYPGTQQRQYSQSSAHTTTAGPGCPPNNTGGGFWTGAGVGGVLGYLAGNSQTRQRQPYNSGGQTGWGQTQPNQASSWGSSGSRPTGGASSSSSTSSSTRTASGFGGTTRR